MCNLSVFSIYIKKNETWRIYVDYQAIDNIIVKYRHPIHRFNDILDESRGSYMFLKIDLKGGYHQTRMKVR